MIFVVAAVFLFCRDIASRGLFSVICSRPVSFEDSCIMLKYLCTTCAALSTKLHKTSQVAALYGRWKLTFSWHQNTNFCRANSCLLECERDLWKPGQSFILAGFTLSLSCSAPCRSGKTTIDTGCDPALLRNCVDHPADCNHFQKCNPIKLPKIRPIL